MDGRLRRDFDRAARTAIAGFRGHFSSRRLSRGVSMVVLEQAAEAFAAPDLAIHAADFVAWFEKTVVETLVVSAPMVVVEIYGDGLTQHFLAEEDHPAQRFGLGSGQIPTLGFPGQSAESGRRSLDGCVGDRRAFVCRSSPTSGRRAGDAIARSYPA